MIVMIESMCIMIKYTYVMIKSTCLDQFHSDHDGPNPVPTCVVIESICSMIDVDLDACGLNQ